MWSQILNGFPHSIILMTSASSSLWAKLQANWVGWVIFYMKTRCTAPAQDARLLIKGLQGCSKEPAVPGRIITAFNTATAVEAYL